MSNALHALANPRDRTPLTDQLQTAHLSVLPFPAGAHYLMICAAVRYYLPSVASPTNTLNTSLRFALLPSLT